MLLITLLLASSGVALGLPAGTVSSADHTQRVPPPPPAPPGAEPAVVPSAPPVAAPLTAAAERADLAPHAEPQPAPPAVIGPFDTRPFSLELRLGIATPTGGIGVAAEYAIVPAFAVGAGIGNNIWGAEPAVWLRLRSIAGRKRDSAFTGSLGLSTAHFEQTSATQAGVFGPFVGAFSSMGHSESANAIVYDRAYWVNADIGGETRSSAVAFRYFVGLTGLLNPSDGVERRSTAMYEKRADSPVSAMLYMGIGVGFSL